MQTDWKKVLVVTLIVLINLFHYSTEMQLIYYHLFYRKLPIIFEPFRQAENPLTRQHGGTGLSLYILLRNCLNFWTERSRSKAQLDAARSFVWIPTDKGINYERKTRGSR